MGKFKAAGGAAAATIEAEIGYASYDEAAMGGPPPKGPYLCRVKRLEGTKSKPKEDGGGNEPMLKAMVIIEEPSGTIKAKYNGYVMNLYRLATDEQAGSMNQFLQALAGGPGTKAKALIKAFWDGNVVTADPDGFGMITKIGTMNIDPKDGFLIGVNTRNDNYNGEKRIAPASYIPVGDLPKPKAAPEDDEDEDDDTGVEPAEEEGDEVEEAIEERREELAELTLVKLKAVAKKAGIAVKRGDDEEALIEAIIEVEFPIEDEPEDEEPDEEADDEKAARLEELEEMSKVALKKAAKEAGGKLADYKALDEEELIEFILDLEFPEDEEDEAEEGDDESAERREELEELDVKALKVIAKNLGLKLAEYRNKDEAELVEIILAMEFPADEEDEEDEAEDEPDEEEEPPAKPARGRAKAGTSPARRRGAKSDEPPF